MSYPEPGRGFCELYDTMLFPAVDDYRSFFTVLVCLACVSVVCVRMYGVWRVCCMFVCVVFVRVCACLVCVRVRGACAWCVCVCGVCECVCGVCV